MKFFTAMTALGFAAQTAAQTTAPTHEQWKALSSDISKYAVSLATQPAVLSLAEALQNELPSSALEDAQNIIPATSVGSGIPYSDLTDTPTIASPSWYTYLDPSLRSEWGVFATSLAEAQQSILTSDLSYTGGAPTATESSLAVRNGAGWMLGVCAGAVAIIAALL